MANAQQGESVAMKILPPKQCPDCPPGNSLPLAPGGDGFCIDHVWWNQGTLFETGEGC